MNPHETLKLITGNIAESCRVKQQVSETMAGDIAGAAVMIAEALRGGAKLLVCGNGGSAADAQHLAAELMGRFQKDRAPYAAVALTTDTSILTSVGNDYGFDSVFERQVLGLGRAGDVLAGITTSGNSPNVLAAMQAARKRDLKTIGITGLGGGKLAGFADLLLAVPSRTTARIQEAHITIIHLICELVENMLMEEA